jgi:hypothetical protein
MFLKGFGETFFKKFPQERKVPPQAPSAVFSHKYQAKRERIGKFYDKKVFNFDLKCGIITPWHNQKTLFGEIKNDYDRNLHTYLCRLRFLHTFEAVGHDR